MENKSEIENKDISKKPKKKKIVILLSILGALVIAAIVITVLQWNNITAIRYSLTYSQEEIKTKLDENNQRIAGLMDRTSPVKVRDLTDDEKKMLARNELSIEEAIGLLLADSMTEDRALSLNSQGANTTDASDTPSAAITNAASVTTGSASDVIGISDIIDIGETSESATNDIIEIEDLHVSEGALETSKLTELVAESFVLRAYYTNRLESMRLSALADYNALDASEKTQSMKLNIGMNYFDIAGVLEQECDKLMDDLISRIESELKRTDGDTSLISDIKSYYAEEKSLKKAYYLSLYNF